MAKIVLPRPWDTVAKVLAGIGATNWGTSELLGFNVLSFVPEGMFTTVAVGAIGAAGLYVLALVYNKKI